MALKKLNFAAETEIKETKETGVRGELMERTKDRYHYNANCLSGVNERLKRIGKQESLTRMNCKKRKINEG